MDGHCSMSIIAHRGSRKERASAPAPHAAWGEHSSHFGFSANESLRRTLRARLFVSCDTRSVRLATRVRIGMDPNLTILRAFLVAPLGGHCSTSPLLPVTKSRCAPVAPR